MNSNHPKKGSITEVLPIMDVEAIEKIKGFLEKHPRDYALFIVGVNTAFRACDLLSLKISKVKDVKVGEEIVLREQKTGKKRYFNRNGAAHWAIQNLINSYPKDDNDWLFRSERTKGPLKVSTLNNMWKKWCRKAHLKGNYGSHSARKTWGWMQVSKFKTPVYLISQAFGHSSEAVTRRYLGIQPEEMKGIYMKEI